MSVVSRAYADKINDPLFAIYNRNIKGRFAIGIEYSVGTASRHKIAA